jgi:hypothetical protein
MAADCHSAEVRTTRLGLVAERPRSGPGYVRGAMLPIFSYPSYQMNTLDKVNREEQDTGPCG